MPQCVAVGRRGPRCGVAKWIGIWMLLVRAASKLRATTCLAQTHNHLILIHSIKYNKTFMVLFTTTTGRVLGGPPTSICEQRPSATQFAPLCKPMCISVKLHTCPDFLRMICLATHNCFKCLWGQATLLWCLPTPGMALACASPELKHTNPCRHLSLCHSAPASSMQCHLRAI